jgi:hypothetical protein
MCGRTPFLPLVILLTILAGLSGSTPLDPVSAQPSSDATATTESSCNFGMAKDEARRSCQVPVPPGCIVASFPGTSKPWSNISKGGNTLCRFNEKETDWKTRITGTCEKCKTTQCSARFGVMFDCSANLPPPITRQAPPKPTP